THVLTSILFFFSSRRRHTRLQGDWSSDVCSSDLEPCFAPFCCKRLSDSHCLARSLRHASRPQDASAFLPREQTRRSQFQSCQHRSEERRVGKERRGRRRSHQ